MKAPDLAELLAMEGAARGLSLRVGRPALARLFGGHRSVHRGRGLEFEEVRPYQPGDDARSIDWRVTARRGRPHTKLFREERERPVWLLPDLHPGLHFGSRRQLKSSLVVRAAALLGWVATLGGDRVGLLLATQGTVPFVLAPRGRRAGLLPVLEALLEAHPRRPAEPRPNGLKAALRLLGSLVHPGSLVLVLSDFVGLDEESEPALAALRVRGECWLFWAVDPLEYQGLPAGRYRAGWPGRLWTLDGDQARARWQAAWDRRERRVTELARRNNLPLTRLETTDAVEHVLPPLLRGSGAAA